MLVVHRRGRASQVEDLINFQKDRLKWKGKIAAAINTDIKLMK